MPDPDPVPAAGDPGFRALLRAAASGDPGAMARLVPVAAALATEAAMCRIAAEGDARTIASLRALLGEYHAGLAAASPRRDILEAACRHVCTMARTDPDAKVDFGGVEVAAWVRHAATVRRSAEFLGHALGPPADAAAHGVQCGEDS